jgi:hypothetical protein
MGNGSPKSTFDQLNFVNHEKSNGIWVYVVQYIFTSRRATHGGNTEDKIRGLRPILSYRIRVVMAAIIQTIDIDHTKNTISMIALDESVVIHFILSEWWCCMYLMSSDSDVSSQAKRYTVQTKP